MTLGKFKLGTITVYSLLGCSEEVLAEFVERFTSRINVHGRDMGRQLSGSLLIKIKRYKTKYTQQKVL